MLNGLSITVLVSGSIAAYKAAELVRELTKRGADVHVVMSDAACEFISPLTMQTLSGNPVTTKLFDVEREGLIGHIHLADSADVVVVAPATADLIAKAAQGIANDCLTTVLLATKAPVVFAPAMNVNMWENPLTKRNVQTLRELGMAFVEPDSGELACGWHGPGRLASTEAILEEIDFVRAPKDLAGSRVIVTAGPTRELIDPVRYISNRSSGRMGYAIAQVARRRGAHVVLISGHTYLPAPRGVETRRVSSATEMHFAVIDAAKSAAKRDPNGGSSVQFVFMAAAVSDHKPAETATKKLKPDKRKGYTLNLIPTPDILSLLGDKRNEIEEHSGCPLKLIGFAAETGDDQEIISFGREKLVRKKIDLIVANRADEALERDTNRVWILDRIGRQEEIATAEKILVAGKIIDAALRL